MYKNPNIATAKVTKAFTVIKFDGTENDTFSESCVQSFGQVLTRIENIFYSFILDIFASECALLTMKC